MRYLSCLAPLALAACSAGSISAPSPADQVSAYSAANSTRAIAPVSRCESILQARGAKQRGVNLKEVAAIFRDANLKKGEFETTEQFKSRAAKLLTKVKSLTRNSGGAGDDLIFEIPVPEAKITYNADQKSLKLGTESGPLHLSRYGGRLLVSHVSRDAGAYVGENAFGAKRPVLRVQRVELQVDVGGASSLSWPEKFRPILLTMAPEEARTAKNSMAVLFVGEMNPPFYEVQRTKGSPSISNPIDLNTVEEILHISPFCALLFNGGTGEALRNLPIRNARL